MPCLKESRFCLFDPLLRPGNVESCRPWLEDNRMRIDDSLISIWDAPPLSSRGAVCFRDLVLDISWFHPFPDVESRHIRGGWRASAEEVLVTRRIHQGFSGSVE